MLALLTSTLARLLVFGILSAFVLACAAAEGAPELPEPDHLPTLAELPDPLTMFDGRKVTSAGQWEHLRRPELKRLFQHYMYGYLPDKPQVRSTVTWENRNYLGGRAVLKELRLEIGPPPIRPVHLLLVVPSSRKKPAPVFVGPNFCGNHAVVDDPGVALPEGWMYPGRPGVVNNRATAAGRGTQINVWNIPLAIERGYGVATFYNGDVEPDDPKSTDGVRHTVRRQGSAGESHSLGAVAAWAWGLQRCVDYLLTDPSVDPRRIVAVGHSRNGKAALVAAAFDERIAMAIPLQAGCGGTSPNRGKIGKSVKAINTSFPHWFCPTFTAFNDHPDRLPFDQHCLIALMAPRPVLLSNAVEDSWANPEGQFEMLRAAAPVYRLLGVDGPGAVEMPSLGKLLNGRLGYFIRAGQHSMSRVDWEAFLDYADRNL